MLCCVAARRDAAMQPCVSCKATGFPSVRPSYESCILLVFSARSAHRAFAWSDLSDVQWHSNAMVAKRASNSAYLFVLLDPHVTVQQPADLLSAVASAGLGQSQRIKSLPSTDPDVCACHLPGVQATAFQSSLLPHPVFGVSDLTISPTCRLRARMRNVR